MTARGVPRETMLSVGGIEVFVREQGEGPPLLLLNGLGTATDTWEALEQRLSARAHTIAVELPGAGRSPTPRMPLSISRLAKIAAGVVAERGYERVDVLGFSFGGIVAQQLAYEEPDLVRRLALVATACGWGSMPGTHEALALISMPVRFHSRTLYERTQALLGPADRALIERMHELTEARLRRPPPVLGYTYQLMAGAFWSSLPWISSVRVPTLVLSGEGDQLVPPANGVQLARLLPESRFHILPDEGHLFVWDPESPALPLLEDFFTSASLARSKAWSTGTAVDDDETVEAAFDTSVGAQPHRALSMAFRQYVARTRDL